MAVFVYVVQNYWPYSTALQKLNSVGRTRKSAKVFVSNPSGNRTQDFPHDKYGVGGVWVQLLGGQGARTRVILVLRECIWNAPAVSLVLPAFDDTGSLGFPPRHVIYPHDYMVPH